MLNQSLVISAVWICLAHLAGAVPRGMPGQNPMSAGNDLSGDQQAYKRETMEEAGEHAVGLQPGSRAHSLHRNPEFASTASFTRHLIRSVTTGSIATVFPSSSEHAGQAFNMLEYHAPCEDLSPSSTFPSLTFLLLPISLSVRNILASDHGEVTYMLREPYAWERGDNGDDDIWSEKGRDRGAMDHTRVALIGNMTILPHALSPSTHSRLSTCYTSYHPDARAWLPGAKDSPHASVWARLDIGDAYYVGGFGDRHFIGHIPVELLVL